METVPAFQHSSSKMSRKRISFSAPLDVLLPTFVSSSRAATLGMYFCVPILMSEG